MQKLLVSVAILATLIGFSAESILKAEKEAKEEAKKAECSAIYKRLEALPVDPIGIELKYRLELEDVYFNLNCK